MKKLTAIFLAAFVFLSGTLCSFAVTGKDERTPAPIISGLKIKESDNGTVYTLSFEDSSDEAEIIRKELYNIALDLHGSAEKLLNSSEAYLCYETKLFCEISTDGENWLTLKEVSSPFDISLYGEILPLLRENGTDFRLLYEGFDFSVRILMASENFREENTETVYVYTPSEEKKLTSPAFSYIHIDTPPDVSPEITIPCYFSGELKEDIALPVLSRKGYTFDGWALEDGSRINVIPKGTKALSVKAHFIAKEYEINYVITKNFNTHFGRVDLSDHPSKYTVGTKTRIPSIAAPIGYIFCGWYNNEEFKGDKITEISENTTGDVILWAKWLTADEAAAIIRQKQEQYIKENKFGDPDADGKISARDARFVLRSVVGLEEISYEALKRVDYFGTNTISSNNARITLRLAVGLEDLHEILTKNGLMPTFEVE